MVVYPVTENFAAEIGDLDLSKPLSGAGSCRNRSCVQSLLGAGLPRPAAIDRPAPRFRAQLRPAGNHHPCHPQRRKTAGARRNRGRVEPGSQRRDLGQGKPQAHVRNGQPDVAYGQFVSSFAGKGIAAVRAQHSAGRRPDRVRRHAGRLRRTRERNETAPARAGCRARHHVLAQETRLYRLLGRGEPDAAACAAGRGTPARRVRAHGTVSRLPRRADLRHEGRGRPAHCCSSSSSTRRNGSSSMRTAGACTTS